MGMNNSFNNMDTAQSDSAEKELADFEKTTVPYDSRSIDFMAKTIRDHYAAAGQRVVEGSATDKRISDAITRAHGVSAEKGLADFEKTTVPYDSRSIDFMAKTIRDHYAAAGQRVVEGSATDKRISDAITRAHGVSAEKGLADFEKTTVPYDSRSIDFMAKTIRDHYAAAGQRVVEGSATDKRISDAITRARGISSEKTPPRNPRGSTPSPGGPS